MTHSEARLPAELLDVELHVVDFRVVRVDRRRPLHQTEEWMEVRHPILRIQREPGFWIDFLRSTILDVSLDALLPDENWGGNERKRLTFVSWIPAQ